MGCAQTRERPAEEELETFEAELQFSNFTIAQINQAFFHCKSNVVKAAQLERVLEELGIKYSPENIDHYKNFLSAFVSFEEEEPYYDLNELLVAVYLLSKSSQSEKAAALFDLYNDEAHEELSRVEVERILTRIMEVVFIYSEKLMDNDEGMIHLHSQIAEKKKEEVLPKVYNLFFAKKQSLNRVSFVKLIEQAQKEGLADFTNPISLRKLIMEYVSSPKKTQVELQQNYNFSRMKRNEFVFADEVDASTCIDSPPTTMKNSQVASPAFNMNKKMNLST